jgi:hypothetical protein
MHAKTGNIKDEFNFQYKLTQSQRSTIQRARVFRSIRFITSEIRNAPQGEYREIENIKSKQAIRFFKTIILQSEQRLRRQRNCWSIPQKKRTTKTTQINRTNQIISQRTVFRRFRYWQQTNLKNYRKTIFNQNSPSNYRSNMCFVEKKRLKPIVLPAVRNKAVEQYEAVRSKAFGLYKLKTIDYLFILQQGMFQWIISEEILNTPSLNINMTNNLTSHPNNDATSITQVLTDMIINAHKEIEYAD